jgi:hypothetical protein
MTLSDTAGRRQLVSAASGFWRWAFRGGIEREAYRSLLSAGIEWLLRDAPTRATQSVVVDRVVPQGVPVTFQWVGDADRPDTLTVELGTGDDVRRLALVLGPDDRAEAAVEPGVYRWRAPGIDNAAGVVAVETFSPEFVPRAPVAGGDRPSVASGVPVGLRELWWVFAGVIVLFLTEWGWRMRRGLP